MAKYDYSNLENKNIFDFCDNQKTLDRIVGFPRDEFIELIKSRPDINAATLLHYADLTSNKALENAVVEQLGKYLFDDIIL